MGSGTACNKLASTYSKKIGYVKAGQTVWLDVRSQQVMTKIACPDVYEKFLLVFTMDIAVGIAVRPNMLTAHVDNAFSAELCFITK